MQKGWRLHGPAARETASLSAVSPPPCPGTRSRPTQMAGVPRAPYVADMSTSMLLWRSAVWRVGIEGLQLHIDA